MQETGRAGCDGLPAVAILLRSPGATRHVDKNKAEYMSNLTNCQRDLLFKKNFDNYLHVDMGLCFCCDVCAKSCQCGN